MNAGARHPEIILVGVVHGDPEGYDKLHRLFERVRPRLISVELSQYSRNYRRRRQAQWQRQFKSASRLLPPELRQHLALQKVAAQIAFPFEARAAEAYARKHGAPWRAIDLNSISREHLPHYETELLTPDNLRQLTSTPDGDWRDYIRQEYCRARRILQGSRSKMIHPASAIPAPQSTLREKVLAHRVARLAREWSKIVHVGGWEHLLRSQERQTMADFLAPWRPELLLLDDELKLEL